MDVVKHCNECQKDIIDGKICDTCGKSTETEINIPIQLSFSFGHNLDGLRYDFCNYNCLLNFIVDELKKQKGEENEAKNLS